MIETISWWFFFKKKIIERGPSTYSDVSFVLCFVKIGNLIPEIEDVKISKIVRYYQCVSKFNRSVADTLFTILLIDCSIQTIVLLHIKHKIVQVVVVGSTDQSQPLLLLWPNTCYVLLAPIAVVFNCDWSALLVALLVSCLICKVVFISIKPNSQFMGILYGNQLTHCGCDDSISVRSL